MLTRDDVIRTAREAWADAGDGWVAAEWFDGKAENFWRFAAAAYAAGAAAEREACALVCEDIAAYWGQVRESGPETGADQCVIAIRQRGAA